MKPSARSVGLQSLAGHTVDDAVAAGVHVPHAVADAEDGEGQNDHHPQDDVEHHRVLACVGRVHVQVRLQAVAGLIRRLSAISGEKGYKSNTGRTII